ncbi:Uu.00g022590.m01.CDS01 [Anthostomella pinea]|uniref:Uu.00g022590.m01.CDS01 n=1 Tax=Anthostomella pinea TaxID=933095 RepID=A0AAI8W0E8_9PEZI|nr:Uu.00g022590.m01.CDS01 [Anthostomella pinea]
MATFKELPSELRIIIWNLALHNEAIGHIVMIYARRVISSKHLISPYLSVNQESRHYARAFYTVEVDVFGIPSPTEAFRQTNERYEHEMDPKTQERRLSEFTRMAMDNFESFGLPTGSISLNVRLDIFMSIEEPFECLYTDYLTFLRGGGDIESAEKFICERLPSDTNEVLSVESNHIPRFFTDSFFTDGDGIEVREYQYLPLTRSYPDKFLSEYMALETADKVPTFYEPRKLIWAWRSQAPYEHRDKVIIDLGMYRDWERSYVDELAAIQEQIYEAETVENIWLHVHRDLEVQPWRYALIPEEDNALDFVQW